MALDPEAEEFVPGRMWGVDSNPEYTEEQPFVVLLKDVLYMLSTNPEAFFDYMSTVTDAMNDAIEVETQLESVADVIFEQSILEPNFTYTGAKMCHYLFNNLKLPKNIRAFRSMINQRVKDVVISRNELLENPETVGTVHGTSFFLAELFLMIEILKDGKQCKVQAYRGGLQELMEALVSHPNTANAKCLAKLLKMVGAAIDEFDKERQDGEASKQIAKIIDKVKQHLADGCQFDKSVNYMWLNLLELRASNWGLGSGEAKSNPVTAGGDAPFSNGPVFYDAEGKVIPEADLDFEAQYAEQQLESDFQDFIAENDEIDELENDFSELEIPAEEFDEQEQYLAPPMGGAAKNDVESLDPEVEQALEEFLQESKNKGTYGYSSRHWSSAS